MARALPVELDLRGVACPLNWAKARVVLEGLPNDATLDLLVDDPRAPRDIPKAAEACGYEVLSVAGHGPWTLTLRK